MPVILHADDFGITRSSTQGILSAWADGALDRFSVMANGRHLEWGSRILATFDRRPQRLAVHLNLLEGRPLSERSRSPLLFSPEDSFSFSFLRLWRLGGEKAENRRALSEQIYEEWRRQINRAMETFPGVRVWSLDSHQHVHVIPWLWEIALKLARQHSMAEIRIPRDRLFQHLCPASIGHWPKPQNFLKVRLINHLITRNFSHRLYAPRFVGGLYYSGEMHRFPLKRMQETLNQLSEEAELLFHPGDDSPPDPQDRLTFPGFYRHENRKRELKALLEFRRERDGGQPGAGD